MFITELLDVSDPEICNDLKKLHPIQSRHKIERMNVEILTDELNQQSESITVWLKKDRSDDP